MNRQVVSSKRVWIVLSVLVCLIIGVTIISLTSGHLPLSLGDILDVLNGEGSNAQRLLLIEFRLPRILIAILVGAGIGISGAIFQGVTQNGLADPGIIGINSGAGLGVVSYLALTASRSEQIGGLAVFSLPLTAFAGGIFAACFIYILAWKNGVTPTRLILIGIGINAGFGAALLFIQLRISENMFNRATVWLSGSIWNAHWGTIWSILPWLLFFIPYAFYKARILNIIHLGDEIASGLGTKVEFERAILLFTAIALSSVSVSAAGGIAFLGLGAPHLARRIVGGNNKRTLPVSALIGSFLLLGSDVIARTLFAPSEIPVGLVVSVIGAPYFIYLLMNVE